MRYLRNYALLAIFATGCMAAEDQIDLGTSRAPILGGTKATVGQYPTVVAVLVNDGWNGLCTGTLIGPDLVLTAAHCVDPTILGYSSQSQVTAATTVVLDNADDAYNTNLGRTIQATNTIPNPGFGGENDLGHDDIALIELAQTVTDRTPTPINRLRADAPVGVAATLVGYGMTNPDDQNSAGTLYVLASKTSVACGYWGSDSLMLCFDQSNGSGICSGDSGGPAFIHIDGELKVAGVTSYSDQNCAEAGAHTRVDAELDFLDAQAPELACQADGVCTETCGQNGLPDDPDCPNCDTSDDCDDPDQQECIDGYCFAKPNTPGGLGYECVDNEDCDSGLCGSDGVDHLCSDICDPAASDCPDGFDCLSAGDNGACWPSAGGGGDDGGGGGCATGHGSAPAAGLLVLLALATVGRRRRTIVRGDRDR